jgi:hypothetical protein
VYIGIQLRHLSGSKIRQYFSGVTVLNLVWAIIHFEGQTFNRCRIDILCSNDQADTDIILSVAGDYSG